MAFAFLLPSTAGKAQPKLSIALLVVAAVIFRAEVALLLATTTAWLVLLTLSKGPSIRTFVSTIRTIVIVPFALSFVYALLVSVPLDSYLWRAGQGIRPWFWPPLWPELAAFRFNAVEGHASEWGVEPWHYYFTSALPRLFGGNLLVFASCLPLALLRLGPAARTLVMPSLLFVAFYSLLPHKETRFVLYVVPPLTAAASLGADWVSQRRAKALAYKVATAMLVLSVAVSFAASTAMLAISSLNYPGGEALAFVKELAARDVEARYHSSSSPTVAIHTDVLSCMTGVSLFGQHAGDPNFEVGHYAKRRSSRRGQEAVTKSTIRPSFVWDKTEDPRVLATADFWSRFDYLLLEDPAKIVLGDDHQRPAEWELVGTVAGYAGIEILRPGVPGWEGGEIERGVGEVRLLVGKGRALADAKRWIRRRITKGWWVGPRMQVRIRILRRRR